MNLLQPIDLYCERQNILFWSEPINALTNFFFIVFGLYLFFKTFNDKFSRVLSLELVMIGVFSFLFHTFANLLTAIMDTFSILIFGFTYLFGANFWFLNLSITKSISGILIFVPYSMLVTFFLQQFLGSMNGSAFYYSYVFLFLGYSIYLRKKNPYVSKNLFICFFMLLISVILRSIDYKFCSNLSLGTHFLWHILNSIVLGVSIITLYNKKVFLHKI